MANTLVSQQALADPVCVNIDAGLTVAEAIEDCKIPEAVIEHVEVTVNGIALEPDVWDTVTIADTDHLAIFVRPIGGGGKDTLRLVALLAVAVAAPQLAVAAGFTAGTTGYALATAGITLVGTLAVNALIPPSQLSVNTPNNEAPGQSYWFSSSSNNFRPYQLCPIVYGQHKIYPAMAAHPLIFSAGRTSQFTGLYDFGLGHVVLREIKVGDTPIDVLGGRTATWTQYPRLVNEADPSQGYKPVPLALYRTPLAQQSLTYGLNDTNDQGQVTTARDSTAAVIDLTFNQGLVKYNQQGEEGYASATFQVEIREVGETQWYPPPALIGYAGDHLRFTATVGDGTTPGLPPAPGQPPIGEEQLGVSIIVDPRNALPRTTGGKVFVGVGKRCTIRFSFNKVVYGVDPTKFLFWNSANPPQDKRSIINIATATQVNNPGRYPVDANGIMGVSMIGSGYTALEFEIFANGQNYEHDLRVGFYTKDFSNSSGDAFYPQTKLSAPVYWDQRIGATQPPPTDPVPPDDPENLPPGAEEVYSRKAGQETYIYMVEQELLYGTNTWLPEGTVQQKWVNGVQYGVATVDAQQQKGTLMDQQGMLGVGGGVRRREAWYSILVAYL